MERRDVLTAGITVGALSVAGCVDVDEITGDAAEELGEEAEEEVEDVVDDLERPPGADLRIDDDGSILVRSFDPDTVGVKCGPIEGDDPVEEVRTHEHAADSVGEEIEGCDAAVVVAVSESGNVEVIEEL